MTKDQSILMDCGSRIWMIENIIDIMKIKELLRASLGDIVYLYAQFFGIDGRIWDREEYELQCSWSSLLCLDSKTKVKYVPRH